MKALFKTIAVINSCKTIKQLRGAKNMVNNYQMMRPGNCEIELLRDLEYKRFKKIREKRRNEKICYFDCDYI